MLSFCGISLNPAHQRTGKRLLQTGFAVPPFFSVILFALFFAHALQHIVFLFLSVYFSVEKTKKTKSCPNAKKQSKKPLRSNRHHHFTYARKKTG